MLLFQMSKQSFSLKVGLKEKKRNKTDDMDVCNFCLSLQAEQPNHDNIHIWEKLSHKLFAS